MTDAPVIIKLPFPCPHCGEEVSGEVGPLITIRQALCGSCGRTIELAGEKMIAVINKVHEAISRNGTDSDDRR
jgi:transcription elongation factor Elf1